MSVLNLVRVLFSIGPRMVERGIAYALRTAFHTTRNTAPNLRGPRLWLAALRTLQVSGKPDLPPLASFALPGAVKSVMADERSRVTLISEAGALEIAPLADDLIRVRARPDAAFAAPFSYSVAKGDEAWPPVEASVTNGADQVAVATRALRLTIDKQTSRLSLQDGAGQPLLAGAGASAYHPASGQVAWQADFGAGTPFYGLGEKTSTLNHAGRRFELWNRDPAVYDRDEDPIYLSVPFVLALVGGQAVGLFFDNSHRTWVDAGAETPGRLAYRAAGGEFCLYLMAGTPEAVLARYTDLTGRMKLPPLWALGFHQSRWSYYPQARVLEIARQFRERRLPCDVIHLDIHYMDGYRCFTWDRSRFPEPRRMIDELHAQGFKALSMIDPGIKVDPGYPVYDEGIAQEVFIKYPDGTRFTGPVWPGDCHFPDFSDPAVRDWWGKQYEPLLDDGLDAFWNDMNEPAIIGLSDRTNQVPDILIHARDSHGATHAEIHNVYGLLMVRASVEGLARLRPERRPLILSRSGWAGLQRYAIHWTGDNQSTWDHLRLTIPMVLNLGLSGVPFTGPDTGGFTGGPSPELFARWMQLGALTPFFRAHSMAGSPDQEPWAFGPEVEAISRRYLELRYRLLPYLYTAVWQAAQSGLPIMRPMFFSDPADARLHGVEDQFFFGDSLLVAPVLEEGATRREVYLPNGVWYDFWAGTHHAGGQSIGVDAPLHTLPLFARGGAAIPLWPVQQYVGEKPVEALELAVYPAPGEHTSLLYGDDGLRPDYQLPEAHRLWRFTVMGEAAGSLRISRAGLQGSYPLPTTRLRLQIAGMDGPPSALSLEGGELIGQAWDGAAARLTVEIDVPGDFTLAIHA